MPTATIMVSFYPPLPPDDRPNYRPNGYHTYQVFGEAGRKVLSGSASHDRAKAWAWALKQAAGKGFTHYRTPEDPTVRTIPN